MTRVIVIGSGGHAKSVIAAMKKVAEFEIVGYVTPSPGKPVLGITCVGDDDDSRRIQKRFDCWVAVIGVGNVVVSGAREKIMERLHIAGFELPTVVSTTAILNEDVKLGSGTVILDRDRAVVNAGTRIGQGCIVNTGAIIDHDCRVGDFVHLVPGTVVGVPARRGQRK